LPLPIVREGHRRKTGRLGQGSKDSDDHLGHSASCASAHGRAMSAVISINQGKDFGSRVMKPSLDGRKYFL
jgi:hypothetical protein